mgnify:FL=1
MKSTKFWTILIGALLLVCVVASAGIYMMRGTGKIANIYQDGELIRSIHLETVTNPFSFSVSAPNGGSNLIQVMPGKICIVEADCPDQVCVETGWIEDGVLPIVCLPHKLVIEISDGGQAIDSAVQ